MKMNAHCQLSGSMMATIPLIVRRQTGNLLVKSNKADEVNHLMENCSSNILKSNTSFCLKSFQRVRTFCELSVICTVQSLLEKLFNNNLFHVTSLFLLQTFLLSLVQLSFIKERESCVIKLSISAHKARSVNIFPWQHLARIMKSAEKSKCQVLPITHGRLNLQSKMIFIGKISATL